MKLTNDIIRALATNEETFQRGKTYYREGNVRKFSVTTGDSAFVAQAQVSGSYFSKYSVRVSILPGGGYGKDTFCECRAFESYDGLCKHCVAVLLKAKDDLKSDIPLLPAQAKAGSAIRQLLNEYAMAADGAAEEDIAGRVRIEPELSFRGTEGIAHLSFRVGVTRGYVVKDVHEFLDAVAAGTYVEYGKELAFTHAPDAFDEKGRALAHLMTERRVECDAYVRFRTAQYGADKRAFALSPAALEEFFALYDGEKVSMGAAGEVALCGADPTVKVTARRLVNREVELACAAGDARAHDGAHVHIGFRAGSINVRSG